VALSLGFCAVVYLPFLQNTSSTVSLSAGDWFLRISAISSAFWRRDMEKRIVRRLATPMTP
jgi:hypothetical protein